MPRDRAKAEQNWARVRSNPTYWPEALRDAEGLAIHWHSPAEALSSQVFCISAFGGLRSLPDGAQVLARVVTEALPGLRARLPWPPRFEYAKREVLGETGQGTPTTIDVYLEDLHAVLCIESKFVFDAAEGFGGCGQKRNGSCAGFHGPGSDLKTLKGESCRLEAKDGRREPRLYWSLGKTYFRESVFENQKAGDVCQFAGPHFQLMRNFLFAATCAGPEREFAVLAIAPEKSIEPIRSQIHAFECSILRESFRGSVGVATYDRLARLLIDSAHIESRALGHFLQERMHS